MSKLARRHRRRKFRKNPSPVRNPPITHDLIEWVAPGFGGFVATRLLTRTAQTVIGKRFPKIGKHAGAVASIGSFLAAWLLGHKVKMIERYHTPITVGAAIAAGQSMLQIYAPKLLGWMVTDASSSVAPKPIAAAPQQQALPQHVEEIDDDPRWYTYNEAYDSGRYGTLSKGTSWQPGIAQPGQEPVTADTAIADPQEGDEELAGGIFGGN